jgi:polysaccharide export outer membrane protein
LVVFVAILMVLLQSCTSAREMAYITDAERDSAQQILSTYANSIHSGDLLYIYVYSETPESVLPFNQETHKQIVEVNRLNYVDTTHVGVRQVQETARQNYLSTSSSVPGYLVDEAGAILFPVLGNMTVGGLTYDSLAHVIEHRLIDGGYLKDPLVTISPMNFRVSVMGEVNRPRELHITGERLTILEALAMCGDLTIYGQRENITVVRNKKGVATPITIDLTKKTIFDSEVYYLQSNDIVYIEPNKHKKRSASLDENWPKYAAFGVALGAAIVNIIRANVVIWRNL